MTRLLRARGLPLALCATLALALGGASVLATCPPDQPGASDLPPDVMAPSTARAVLTMQAEGAWKYNCTDFSPSPDQYLLQIADPERGGSYANLTGGGYDGWFYPKPSGDAAVLLWRQGKRADPVVDSLGYAVLTMGEAPGPASDSGTTRPDVRYGVGGCSTGTAGSIQDSLPLPPIYLAVKSNYTEPTSQPPPPSEEQRTLPASCDPKDPKQATLAFPWKGTFTFYTC